ncbi:hypothetical protein CROQUDRAFT_95923 [Cronartium quercuum f. sp. fusiforme G11]|uniref:Uncharacterized protein n=1 Tax=Cronartium quercuum f. sp. fusiforme G11 TaxID=708437 RepID=A0A9P6NBU5_9BASI|nr:hypothetical protein CROQUDRAFT_95923 [Cronartium quercuum f. sp. fusiforme G11]
MLSNKVFSFGVVFLLACFVIFGFVIASSSEEEMRLYNSNLVKRDDGLTLAELSRFYTKRSEASLEERDGGNNDGGNYNGGNNNEGKSDEANNNGVNSHGFNINGLNSNGFNNNGANNIGDSKDPNSSEKPKYEAKNSGPRIRVDQMLWGLLGGATFMVFLA